MKNKTPSKKGIKIGNVFLPFPDKRKFMEEVIGNAVAYAMALMISGALHSFFAVRSIKNLWGIMGNKRSNKIMIDQDTFDWISWGVAFVVGLFVFTIVDHYMELYFEKKKEKELSE